MGVGERGAVVKYYFMIFFLPNTAVKMHNNVKTYHAKASSVAPNDK